MPKSDFRVVSLPFLVALALAPGAARGGPPPEIVSSSDASDVLAVQQVSAQADGTVSGVLVNRSSDKLRDVKLLVEYAWLWKNEKRPGTDDPSFAGSLAAGDVPAGQTAPFTYRPSKALPARSDGSFQVTVQVVGFTREKKRP